MDDSTAKPALLAAPDGATIAYRQTPGKGPGTMFLTGFRSDMTGGKALAVESLCRAQGRAFVRFDYTGHGLSSGAFADGTIGRWTEDALLVLDRVTQGPQVLVGSSMGGWIALLLARARPGRIAGLVGIAAAPDFTEDLVHDVLDADARERMARDGQIVMPSAYDPEPCVITQRLIEEGRKHLLLRAPIAASVPVRLIHGLEDHDVPWRTSLKLAERLASADVEITLVKGGRHRLSEPADLARLAAIVDALLQKIG
ncbi:MAG: alpha/beta fold hydrolase [Rhodospirillales bacterium]|nr:alpha/beta fold hydrolase [Rhodospirillales bacterium]MSP79663.1 alpha/beta fold hydrolase [Rhodospirillales bacterium]